MLHNAILPAPLCQYMLPAFFQETFIISVITSSYFWPNNWPFISPMGKLYTIKIDIFHSPRISKWQAACLQLNFEITWS